MTNAMEAEVRRQADVYVFALLAHREKRTLDPLDLSQWEFFVVPARVLNARLPRQKQLSLSTLLTLKPAKCAFNELPAAVSDAARGLPDNQ